MHHASAASTRAAPLWARPPLHRLTQATLAALAALTTQATAQQAPIAAEPAGNTLPGITVTGTQEPGYKTPVGGASTKSDTPLVETPMSVQVVPREVLDDQRAYNLYEAIKNVSGVLTSQYTFYDFVQIRGFANGYAANYRNGLQLQAISGLDMALVDSIEVVKGPASMLYGRIEPGGLVNQVMKRPQAASAYALAQEAGSFGLWRTTLDATGPVTGDKTLRYRVVGAYTRSESFMDFVQKRNAVGSLALAWQPSADFQLNVALEAQSYRFADTEDIGIPIIGDRAARVPRNRFYGDPVNWEIPNKQNRTLLAYDWTWAINDAWKLTQRLHYDKRREQQLTLWFNGFDGVSVLDRGLWYVHPERSTLATNLDLAGDVQLGGMRHRVLVGADWFRFRSSWHGFSDVTAAVPSIDIFNPTYGISADALRALPENFFYADYDQWAGLYAQDQVTLGGGWQLLVGGRYDTAKTGFGQSDSIAAAQAALQVEKDTAFSPRAGLLYLLAPTTSLYASYSSSFGTNNARSASGVPFEPEKARQIEFGVKHQTANGKLGSTVSIYRLTKTNVLTADLSTPDPDDQAAIGQVRSQGIELDVIGQLTRNVSLIATWALTDTRVTRDNDGNQGRRLPNVPRNATSLWAKFDAAPGERGGWEAGAGVYLRSQRQGDVANSWQLPGYARVDAMARYRLPAGPTKVSAQLNVENLFDRTYLDRGGSGGTGAKYGSPRAIALTLGVDF